MRWFQFTFLMMLIFGGARYIWWEWNYPKPLVLRHGIVTTYRPIYVPPYDDCILLYADVYEEFNDGYFVWQCEGVKP